MSDFRPGAVWARVPWHRSLFVRLFLIGALIAVVAVAAATWATVRSTTVAVRQEQQQSLHADATTYDALIGYAATHRSWVGAASLVDRLARNSGHRVAVTDLAGRTILDSSGGRERRPPAQARARLDALAVDTALLATAEPSVPAQSPQASPIAKSGECGGTCQRYLVEPTSVVDGRVVGPFIAGARPAWSRLEQRVNTCLAEHGLKPVLAMTEGFKAIVDYPQEHGRVAHCVETARQAMLKSSVAPPALLFVGGGDPAASVLWDLSGRAKLRIALLAAAVFAVTLLLTALLAGYVVRPLRRMAAAARQAGEGDLTVRVPERRRDEVGAVATAFNRMADRREQLEGARRRMVSDVSHELRTPLANVRGWLEAAQDGLVDPDPSFLESLHEETLQLQHLVDDLHDLSVGDAGELRLDPVEIDLAAFLGQLEAAFRGAAETAGVVLTAVAEPGARVVADPVRLRQAVANLVANALRHTPAGGRIELRGAEGLIAVSDTGEGIPAEALQHVFERFRRADPARGRGTGGSGLGLAIVRQIVEAHGGSATAESVAGQGTTITLGLPR